MASCRHQPQSDRSNMAIFPNPTDHTLASNADEDTFKYYYHRATNMATANQQEIFCFVKINFGHRNLPLTALPHNSQYSGSASRHKAGIPKNQQFAYPYLQVKRRIVKRPFLLGQRFIRHQRNQPHQKQKSSARKPIFFGTTSQTETAEASSCH